VLLEEQIHKIGDVPCVLVYKGFASEGNYFSPAGSGNGGEQGTKYVEPTIDVANKNEKSKQEPSSLSPFWPSTLK